MKRMLILSAALVMAITAAGVGGASAAPCRDAKGKFTKCSTAAATATPAKAAPAKAVSAPAAKPGPAMAAKPAPVATASKRCKDAKGKFAKCSAAGAHPA